MEPRIRVRDIAEELGLSTATVSNVIHGKTGKVSDETVRKVMELLEKRQYIPNMANSVPVPPAIAEYLWHLCKKVDNMVLLQTSPH